MLCFARLLYTLDFYGIIKQHAGEALCPALADRSMLPSVMTRHDATQRRSGPFVIYFYLVFFIPQMAHRLTTYLCQSSMLRATCSKSSAATRRVLMSCWMVLR